MKQTLCDNPNCRSVIVSNSISSTWAVILNTRDRYDRKEYEFCGVCTGRVARAIGGEFKDEMIGQLVDLMK